MSFFACVVSWAYKYYISQRPFRHRYNHGSVWPDTNSDNLKTIWWQFGLFFLRCLYALQGIIEFSNSRLFVTRLFSFQTTYRHTTISSPDFSTPRLFVITTFYHHDFSAPRLFSTTNFRHHDFSSPDLSSLRHFFTKTFRHHDISSPRHFVTTTFRHQDFVCVSVWGYVCLCMCE